KTNSVFFSKFDEASNATTLYKADMYTGEVSKLVTLPPRVSVSTINADETLGAGTYTETAAGAAQEYGRNRARGAQQNPKQAGNLVQAEDKQQMMERRLAAHIPVVLFTVNLQTGKMTTLLHSTD